MRAGREALSMGWTPEAGFLRAEWGGMSEGILAYVPAIGSARHAIPPAAWTSLRRELGRYGRHRFLVEGGWQALFRYQYPLLWLDLSGLDDGLADYEDSARQAVRACRRYCMDLAPHGTGYGPRMWGLSAADDPGNRYGNFGFPPGRAPLGADGTVVPYAVAGSVFLEPKLCIAALRCMYDRCRAFAWGKYGLADSVRPVTRECARDVIGIDQGTIILGIENYLSGEPRRLAMAHPTVARGLRRMGFVPRQP
jgi:hypothetical protein